MYKYRQFEYNFDEVTTTSIKIKILGSEKENVIMRSIESLKSITDLFLVFDNSEIDKTNIMINNYKRLLFQPDISNVMQIESGDNHTVVLTENSQIYTFGRNQFGQLGINNTYNSSNINKVSVDIMTFKASRPKNMALNVKKISTILKYDLPSTEDSLRAMKRQYDKNKDLLN